MILPTHLLAGCVAFGHAPTPGECAAAIACAALPDLDRRTSIVGRALPFVSGPLEYWFGHRGFSHSLVLQASIGLLAWLTPPFGFALAVVFGLLSHTVMDMLRLSPGTVPTGS